MEVQIKRAIKAGNSSAIILPRAWLNKEVRIELVKKDNQMILKETLEILTENINLSKIIGIYLVGSYARSEESKNSDIDILVITDDIDCNLIKEGIYNITIISSQLLKQKLENDLFPIGQMIREAKPLLNSAYLNSVNVKITRKNVKWYLDTTQDKLNIIKEAIRKMKNAAYLSDLVAYTLILRIRTLYIIQKIIKNENYSKGEFVRIIKNIANGDNAYERYIAMKNDGEDKKAVKSEEAISLYRYLENQLKITRKML